MVDLDLMGVIGEELVACKLNRNPNMCQYEEHAANAHSTDQ